MGRISNVIGLRQRKYYQWLSVGNWIKKNKVGLDITQITFLNWNAGGNTSISGLAKGNFERKY